MDGQMDLFDFIDPPEKKFDPIKDYARHGSGFLNGENRIKQFFLQNKSLKDRADFLKNRYGVGGFAIPCKQPFEVHMGDSNAKGCRIQYFDENMENVVLNITYAQLAKAIDEMIADGEY